MNAYCVVGAITGGERLKPYLLFKKIEHFVLSDSGDAKTLGVGPCVFALMPLRVEVVGTLNQIFLNYTSPNAHSQALLLWVGTVMVKTKAQWLKSCMSLFQERYIRHIKACGL